MYLLMSICIISSFGWLWRKFLWTYMSKSSCGHVLPSFGQTLKKWNCRGCMTNASQISKNCQTVFQSGLLSDIPTGKIWAFQLCHMLANTRYCQWKEMVNIISLERQVSFLKKFIWLCKVLVVAHRISVASCGASYCATWTL